MVAGKGGSRQRVYFCDQHKQIKCPASIRWVKQTTGEWKVSNLDGTHVNCAGAMTSGSIRGKSHVIEDIVSNDTSISGPKLQKAAEGKAGGGKLHLRSYQRAKKRMAEGDAAQEAALMHKLRPYFKELEEHSPGTVTNVEADEDGAMTRCFVMCGKAVRVAKTTGVKACSMDAGFIKTEHQGQLITLGIRDDDNKILMVAAAIVDKEDESSYTYFLSNCMKSPDFAATFNDPSMTVFVDGHKGSPPALRKCAPLMEVYRCLQHYLKNAPAIGSDLVPNVYNAARAPTRAAFDSYMKRVGELKPATFNHLMTTLPLHAWTHHACKQDTRIGDTTTSNNAESLISSVSEEVRNMGPLKMVEAMVDQLAAKCAERAKTGARSNEIYTPYAVQSFDTERDLSNGLVVKEFGNDTFKVECGGLRQGSNTVDLAFRPPESGGHVMKCTCGFCTRHGIPCRHALAVVKHLGRMDVARELIDDGYNVKKYRESYGDPNFCIRPPSVENLESDLTLLPPKPVTKKSGRPKGKRVRKRRDAAGEGNTSSRYNERTSAPGPGAAAAAGGAAEPALSQPTLSQQTSA